MIQRLCASSGLTWNTKSGQACRGGDVAEEAVMAQPDVDSGIRSAEPERGEYEDTGT